MKIPRAITALSLVLTADQQKGANAWAPSTTTSHTSALMSLIAQQQHRYSSKRALYSTKDKEETTATDTTAAAFQDSNESKILGQPIPYSQLTLGVAKETYPGENRVSQTPDSIRTLVKARSPNRRRG